MQSGVGCTGTSGRVSPLAARCAPSLAPKAVASSVVVTSTNRASLVLRDGRGLKRLQWDVSPPDSDASLVLRDGRGLKPYCHNSLWRCRLRIARPSGRARIETSRAYPRYR